LGRRKIKERMKIYFLHAGMISFVKKDFDILKAVHQVRAELNYGRAIRNLFKNFHGVRWSDLVFCWFASLNFLPSIAMAKLFGKKIVVVAGGYDVANLPEIDYGNMRRILHRASVRFICRLADKVISVSESNKREAIENAKVDQEKITLIYHGFVPVEESAAMKERMVITAGEVTFCNLKRKGLEDFVRAAEYFPQIPFKVIGRWTDDSYKHLRSISPKNVEVLGFIDDSAYVDILSRAKVYVQASRHEGFGCSVAEAMLYKCIPVVNNVFALPEVVGDAGFLAVPGDIESLKEQIEIALDADESLGDKARKSVLKNFPLSKRREALLNIVAHV
jgi:glycosyltransferase involved in cell wall biosynthesis